MKRRKTGVLFLAIATTVTMLLGGCSSAKLADSFEESAVREKAKEVIGLYDQDDFEAINAMTSDEVSELLTAELLQDSKETHYSNLGAFKEFKSISVIGQTENEVDMAVVLLIAVYENQKVTYRIVFDTDMNVIGFFAS